LIDINKLKLPSKRLEKEFRILKFDVVIDLEKEENLFNSLLVCIVNAPVKVGFRKKNSDKFYNLQIDNMEVNPEIFYKNLLNCLQMF
jgi:ADP-heptose:LPS heptosyltransferase